LFDRVQARFTLADDAPAMSDLLAIFGPSQDDGEMLAGIAAYHPDRVTVLMQGADQSLLTNDSAEGEALRSRLADLMAAIEQRTGAMVVGLAGDRSQLRGWRFDRELTPSLVLAA
jgi:hypothetical protein